MKRFHNSSEGEKRKQEKSAKVVEKAKAREERRNQSFIAPRDPKISKGEKSKKEQVEDMVKRIKQRKV